MKRYKKTNNLISTCLLPSVTKKINKIDFIKTLEIYLCLYFYPAKNEEVDKFQIALSLINL